VLYTELVHLPKKSNILGQDKIFIKMQLSMVKMIQCNHIIQCDWHTRQTYEEHYNSQ